MKYPEDVLGFPFWVFRINSKYQEAYPNSPKFVPRKLVLTNSTDDSLPCTSITPTR